MTNRKGIIGRWRTQLAYSCLVILSLMMLGCASEPEVIVPVAYDSTHSEALNMANQTYLTKSYTFGFETRESPLRDFTLAEIEEVKTALNKPKKGGGLMLIGLIGLASGDITGALGVASGGISSISNSDHVAAHSQWVVALDATPFKDGFEAKRHASRVVRETAIALLEEKGNKLVPIIMREEGEASLTGAKIHQESAYAINDPLRFFGLYYSEFDMLQEPFGYGRTNLIDAPNQYVSTREANIMGDVANFKSFIDGQVKGYEGLEGYEKFLLDLTARLPQGYLLYMPSFPQGGVMTVTQVADWTCYSCQNIEHYMLNAQVVPSIYTQGKRYDFIVPVQ
ncbi:hypothetical protein VST7929_01481 [Vibrio stylophorae]|uniref:Uncharacterized protein n=1 Tax=Vibrio stylophorae TaxID=659351 RepID=A0ABM8ZTG9_9VIBR|nr:hypothetical protein [Vibrio stylophorae]CAH0533611.1 hypothetical protein VST7929_01481 [Vibrio stylophorae]